MSIIGIAGAVGSLACSLGASQVTKHIIVATTPENLTKATKALVWVGRKVVPMMVGAAAGTYFGAQYDKTVEVFKKVVEPKVQGET